MNYMRDILNEMKIRPILFLGENKIEYLYAYINGYMHRLFQEEDIVPEFYPGFQEYIEDIYNVITGQHWTKILVFYSEDEEEALYKFFKHLEEFTEINENTTTVYPISPAT